MVGIIGNRVKSEQWRFFRAPMQTVVSNYEVLAVFRPISGLFRVMSQPNGGIDYKDNDKCPRFDRGVL